MEIRRIFTDAMLVNLIAAIGMLVFVPLFLHWGQVRTIASSTPGAHHRRHRLTKASHSPDL